MEVQHENGETQKLHIVSIMSVPPLKVTEPRRVHKVLVSEEENTRAIHGCYKVVLYYENLKDEEEHDNWCLAGWIVESLARVLLDHPLLAGRLQRTCSEEQEQDTTTTGFEIVSNDSGIRLLQVTNFECGGYSIGISCSLLLAEVFLVENFLGKWAEIHNNNNNKHVQTPIFHQPRLKNLDSLPPDIISRTQSQNGGVESVVFKIKMTAEDAKLISKELWRELAMLCVEEAGGSDNFCLVVKESSDVTKVESCSMNSKRVKLNYEMSRSTWEEFGEYDVAFNQGNKPVQVSCWVDSVTSVPHGYAMPLSLNLNVSSAAVILLLYPQQRL